MKRNKVLEQKAYALLREILGEYALFFDITELLSVKICNLARLLTIQGNP